VLLEPVLATNWDHLGPWIPRRIAEHAPVPVLAQRLAGFAVDFDADREWRYGMFSTDERTVLGEVALFPRSESGRVQYADADRAELGYWLRFDMTGEGFVTEAARAVLAVAARLPQVSCIEIRCDSRNLPSAAVPRRLGFSLATSIPTSERSPGELQVWVSECSRLGVTDDEG
jgi:RimJ/RimL family protein N-acetyltransferase